MEIWKDIYFWQDGIEWDYRGKYQVSNYGNVKSLIDNHGQKREKVMKPRIGKNGYFIIGLSKNSKQKTFKIHRLVAHMFLSDSYFENAQVNHIDENKENNHFSNLEWCTVKYNNNYGTRNKRAGEKNKISQKGKKATDETRKKQSEAHKGEKNHNYGKHLTQEQKRKISETNRGSLIARYDLNMNLIDIKYNFEYGNMEFSKTCISYCCKGKAKSHKGYIFKYWNDANGD